MRRASTAWVAVACVGVALTACGTGGVNAAASVGTEILPDVTLPIEVSLAPDTEPDTTVPVTDTTPLDTTITTSSAPSATTVAPTTSSEPPTTIDRRLCAALGELEGTFSGSWIGDGGDTASPLRSLGSAVGRAVSIIGSYVPDRLSSDWSVVSGAVSRFLSAMGAIDYDPTLFLSDDSVIAAINHLGSSSVTNADAHIALWAASECGAA